MTSRLLNILKEYFASKIAQDYCSQI